jgi:hypothetical protein
MSRFTLQEQFSCALISAMSVCVILSELFSLQVHKVSQVALKRDHVFVDTVGQDTEDTHAKVSSSKF